VNPHLVNKYISNISFAWIYGQMITFHVALLRQKIVVWNGSRC